MVSFYSSSDFSFNGSRHCGVSYAPHSKIRSTTRSLQLDEVTRLYLLASHAQKLSTIINVSLGDGQEVFGRHAHRGTLQRQLAGSCRSRPRLQTTDRSEERSVGKECRTRWSPDH